MSLVQQILKVHPHACLFIDATWKDLVQSFHAALTARNRDTSILAIQEIFHRQCIVTLSARTAFDLWLRVNQFPKGSEIIMTAINIPDMVKVIREHGLIPVPVDIDMDTLAPQPKDVSKLINDKTVAVLVAQIYGRQFPIEPIAEVLKERKIPLIEDLAECYAGPEFTGSQCATLSLFSFGPIKFNTAFGGGIVVVRDQYMYQQMLDLHNSYNIRESSEMTQKLAKYAVVMFLLNVPIVTGLVIRMCAILGIDHKAYVVSLLRGFPANFFEKLRHRPDPVLLKILENRLKQYDEKDFELQAKNGEALIQSIQAAETRLMSSKNSSAAATSSSLSQQIFSQFPGLSCPVRNHWLFPLLVQDPNATMAELNKLGIDAYRGATQLNLVDRPEEYKGKMESPPNAKKIMEHTIYLPIHKRVPAPLINVLADDVARIVRKVNKKPVFTPPAAETSSPAPNNSTVKKVQSALKNAKRAIKIASSM